MSHILFGSTIDMLILATPSTGYVIAYDLDNTLKQKDSNGDLSPIGGSQNLSTVLKYGNNTGTYSILLGTYSEINSFAGGKISLSDGGTQSILIYLNNLSATSSINLKPEGISIFNKSLNNGTQISIGDSYSLITSTESNGHIISTDVQNSYNNWSLKFHDNSLGSEYVGVIYSENISDGNDSLVKASLHLNTNNSTTEIGLQNSVIIGGSGLNATQSNTVYLGNQVNINNSYNLPINDGSQDQVIKTDGLGNLTWVDLNSFVVGLGSVLSVSNNTGANDIEIESGYSIKSSTSSSILTLDKNSLLDNISISNSNSEINLTPSGQIIITTLDGDGLIYANDYSLNFTPESIVSKRYVDNLVSSLNIDIHYEGNIVYVDPLYGNDDTGLSFRRDLPFLTVASASEITNIGLIYMKSGIYNEMCVLKDNLKYYCEAGVIFESGGFTDYTSIVNCDIYGYAKFIGNSPLLKPFTINNLSNVNFEFDVIDISNTYQGIIVNNSLSVNIRGNKIKSLGTKSIQISGVGNINFYIKGDIIGKYNTISFEDFAGECVINSDNIITNTDVYEDSYLYAVNTNNGVTGKVTINSDIRKITEYTTSVKTNSAVRISSGYFKINGDIYSGVEYSLIVTGNSLGNVTINGNLTSSVETLLNDTTKIILKLNSPLISTIGLFATYSMVFNNQSEVYIQNSNIVNLTDNSNLIWIGNTNSIVKLYNTNGFSNSSNGYFIDANNNLNVGIHNVRSNKDNNLLVNDLFEPSGFIYDSNFYLPNF
jgi:hypothetical protein